MTQLEKRAIECELKIQKHKVLFYTELVEGAMKNLRAANASANEIIEKLLKESNNNGRISKT